MDMDRSGSFIGRSELSGITVVSVLENWSLDTRGRRKTRLNLGTVDALLTELTDRQSEKVFVGVRLTTLSLSLSLATELMIVHIVFSLSLISYEYSAVHGLSSVAAFTS